MPSEAFPGALQGTKLDLSQNPAASREHGVMPGVIPPRTSSYGAVAGANNSLKNVTHPAPPEEEWIAQSKHPQKQDSTMKPMLSNNEEFVVTSGSTWSKEKEEILQGPYEYMLGHPGKDIRAQMIASFNLWLKVPEESLNIITNVVGMLHTASLLVDDVEDDSQLRRGVPVAHSIFGTAQTINCANYTYFLALQELFKLKNPATVEVYMEELLNLHRGQGMDLYWRDTLTCPSEEDYLEMVGNKTGGLFRLAIKLMQAESATQIDCVPLIETIGLLFQILDDYKNLSDSVYTANKGMCEDLTEGKFSFPVIHSIHMAPNNHILINILKQKTKDEEVKKYALSYMAKTGSFSYTRRVIRSLAKKAISLVDELEQGREKGEGIRTIIEKLNVKDTHDRTLSSSSG